MKNRNDTRILIVEDEVPMARIIADGLKSEGFHVSVASNGQEGLEILKKVIFDVAILDIAMPEVDGMEMMHRIRQDPKSESLPIIIYTNMVPDNKIIAGVSEDKPTYYLLKTERGINDIVRVIDEIIAA